MGAAMSRARGYALFALLGDDRDRPKGVFVDGLLGADSTAIQGA
jgi:hypothetical protein